MNILFLALDVDLTTQRGDSIHARELARFLAARGNRVNLVTATRGDSVPDMGANVRHHTRFSDGDLRTVQRCAEIARQSNAVALYERRLSPKIAFGVSRLLGIPFVVEVNGVEEEASMQGRPDTSPWRPVKTTLRRAIYKSAARIVVVSDRLSFLVAARTGVALDRIAVVPNGVDPDQFAPIDAAEARRRLGLAPTPWIVYVGNLVPWQGLETALHAMPLILDHDPEARLAIVGDGMLRESLKRMAVDLGVERAIVLTGTAAHGQVPLHIGAAAVCVAPFTRDRNEGIGLSPLKIFEYMACARPVVASAIPGITELLERSGAGVVVPPDDPEAFAQAVLRLLSDPDLARAMGGHGREFALAECTWAKTAERVEQILQEAVRAG